jgi:DNA-binding winged helix-turn-helix (wHTH) protein
MSARLAYRFGDFLVEPATQQFWCAGERRDIDPEALRLLAFLVEHPEQDFTTSDIRTNLWPSQNFLDGERSLNHAVSHLREALNESLAKPRYLARTEGGGYRFIHPVRVGKNEPDLALASAGATMTPASLKPNVPQFANRRRFFIFVIAAQLLAFALMFFLFIHVIRQGR